MRLLGEFAEPHIPSRLSIRRRILRLAGTASAVALLSLGDVSRPDAKVLDRPLERILRELPVQRARR